MIAVHKKASEVATENTQAQAVAITVYQKSNEVAAETAQLRGKTARAIQGATAES